MNVHTMKIRGKTIDQETRCIHYHTPKDVIAIKFKCCQQYYPCYQCHEEEVHHPSEVWSAGEFDTKAILCGVCKTELTIREYMASNNTCPHCKSLFNPNCSRHYHLYFDTA